MFVTDQRIAFPLIPQIMKRYAQRNLDDKKRMFNYRLSRFRRVTENTFGIWACRFRIFLTRINSPEVATGIVLASVTLHNMLRTKSRDTYSLPEFIDKDIQAVRPGTWRRDGSSKVTPRQAKQSLHKKCGGSEKYLS